MHRGFLFVLCSLAALAQPQPANPLDVAVQAYQKARADGRPGEAAQRREQARVILERLPADAPEFGGWAMRVVQLYQEGGMYGRARDVAEAALARTNRLPETHPSRIALLTQLTGLWEEDRSLVKAVSYLEREMAALEAAPEKDAAAQVMPAGGISYSGLSSGIGRSRWFRGWSGSPLSGTYQRLANLYQQLGRPDAAAAVLEKMKKLAVDDRSLASFYEGQGKLDEAEAIYRKQASAATNPQEAGAALQGLAFLYQREQRWDDAAAALQQGVAAVAASSDSLANGQVMGLRTNLINMLRQAGKTAQADQMYEQVMADYETRQPPDYAVVVSNYAHYLLNSNRAAQAEAVLNDFANNHPQLDGWEAVNLLQTRATAARNAGDADKAAGFEREAQAKIRAQMPTAKPEQARLQELLQQANAAAWGAKPEEAFSLALQAIAESDHAVDREQIAWQIPSVASGLAQKSPAKAEQLYQHLFATIESWSDYTLQPLVNVSQNYARFLMGQKDRRGEVPDAIDRYRKLLVTQRGASTGHMQEVWQMKIDYERSHDLEKQALVSAQDYLAFEASLNGATSEPYLQAVETAADLQQTAGNPETALRYFRQAVDISDLVFMANDARRGQVRFRMAFGLARLGRFDEAEKVAAQAIELGRQMRPSPAAEFTQQLEQLRRMKPKPAPAADPAARPAASPQWFQKVGQGR